MKPIKFNGVVSFTKARTNGYQRCIYCEKKIGKGNVGLSMVKETGGLNGRFNVWLHLNCIEPFFKKIIKFKKNKMKEIILGGLK